VRWDNLRLIDPPIEADGEPMPLTLFDRGAVTRTFNTPEFRGITFYEIHARTIINRVPAASRMPFRWTINPYRGCSHACTYCLVGDTLILMADGQMKPLAQVKFGDLVYGTVREGRYRRYVTTQVLDHWSTTKPAYRILLADGTKLIASADHRLLTDRGWKYVRDAPNGPTQRAHLTSTDRLMSIGSWADVAPERSISGEALTVSAALRVVSVEPLGIDMPMFDITTGTGDFIANGVVSHNCFARKTHTYLEFDAGRDFDSRIVVKVNAAERLRRELARPSWRGEQIAMGTNVDCYQRAEGRYQLMRGILTALRDAANPYSILTKGSLILRDLDLLTESAKVTDVGLAVSVGFVDEQLWQSVESGTPSPRKRLEVCAALTEAGLRCSVLMAPILPFLTDSPAQLERAVRAIAEAGAHRIVPIVLHLRPGAREWYLAWLGEHHPELVPAYNDLYARGSYAPRAYQDRVTGVVRALAERHRVTV